MSTIGEENNSDDDNLEFALHRMKEIKIWELEKVYDYIEQLHQLLEKKNKKLIKFKQKYKKLLEKCDGSKKTAIKDIEAVKKESDNDMAEASTENAMTASDAFSFVDEMRQAAAQAQNLNDFVYEPTSGLYYDQKTGYYYNAEYGLYYDGNTGCYYRLNQEKNSFEFHSQVQVQPTQTEAKTTAADENCKQEQYVNKSLLNSFSKLSIEQMRKNALGENSAKNADGAVEFDEWGGVITDPEKLQKIKEDKLKLRQEREKYKKRSKKQKEKDEKKERRKRKHKHKKRKDKHATRSSNNSDDSANDSDDGDDERGERYKKKRSDDVEDGELSTSSNSSKSSETVVTADEHHNKDTVAEFKSGSRFQDIAKKYPPSLRIVVQDTNLEQLKVGSLSLITYKGGILGREGNHDVIVPDLNVSKFHLKFTYDHKQAAYKCIDLGSRNGTILNGKRMSTSKTESEAYELVHGSVIQIGQTKLLCHVHEGNSTCGLCEPGLLIETTRAVKTTNSDTVLLTHKEQLKKLQKRYGLENEKFVDGNKTQTSGGNYIDRAATRRVKVGSTTDKEKTQTASVDTEIPSENKGFRMLAKLGWNKGETLGKTNIVGGLLEPINVTSNEGTKGLGCEEPAAGIKLTAADKRKMALLKKTQERYQKADIFIDSDDSD